MLASLRSYHSMLRRQKPRIEAPTDRLGDYDISTQLFCQSTKI